jgi:hypothetical protein
MGIDGSLSFFSSVMMCILLTGRNILIEIILSLKIFSDIII